MNEELDFEQVAKIKVIGVGNLYRSCGNSERNSFYYPE